MQHLRKVKSRFSIFEKNAKFTAMETNPTAKSDHINRELCLRLTVAWTPCGLETELPNWIFYYD